MTKSELIEKLIEKNRDLPVAMVDEAVNEILEQMSQSIISDERIEIRGFGSFTLHLHQSRQGRNPKTGESLALEAKYIPHFKAGKELRLRVDSL